MLANRKELQEKDRRLTFAKQVVTKNPIFSKDQIEDFFSMFNLYCDARRQCDVNDILSTAKTLGFDKKYRLIYRGIEAMVATLKGEWVNFETFLRLLTDILGNPFTEQGRVSMFRLINPNQKEHLELADLREISEDMRLNLSESDLIDVINNVAGFGKDSISWDQFNRYLARKTDKKNKLL